MLTDLGLQTEEQIKQRQNDDKTRYEQMLKGVSTGWGCVGTRICENCKHLISDSICLCIPVFTCPNCQFKNGEDVSKAIRDSISNEAKKINIKQPFMFKDIAEYERTVGFSVNEAFKMGWNMARAPAIK